MGQGRAESRLAGPRGLGYKHCLAAPRPMPRGAPADPVGV